MGIGEYVSDSFGYANEGLIGKWMRWIILIICSIIFPLIMGYSLRVMKGVTPAPEPGEYVGMLIDGIKMIIINIVYMIIPIIIGIVVFSLSGGFGSLTMLGMNVSDPVAYMGLLFASFGLSLLVFMIVAFIFSLFGIIGMVRFARMDSMGEAFAFGEITATIGRIGWVQYILALIVLMIILFVIYMILGMIPVIGILLELILAPYISIAIARYYSQLYDAGS
ncbi:DUF4013 domain-containing protein [Methanospirillum stamsii]|uniref:DUF4013 domain-containing protein n=1 Tax=Methanospirillum stamsii TaxID=1277351 RepID=A0A2V2N607_9EURY|nr:DUF4013 domain-containing protein [Methanospirillum stamsii]PWR70723.1 hypothetical protein DLD82_14565 [Methanospirillum stamsii]